MRLEKITLDGFKSFADKTEFTFDSSLTAIVGPNGCGKSNIADAVKWVLGEQSVKSLRSEQMADVIFSGSSRKKALGTAEVSLFISNTGGQLPLETDQVQIARRIYKSGESEYRINNKLCRLKDIRELFMDTGVAAKAYSIIEQGQVKQLLTASKIDRRVIFEEAAGISKYKAHKKEALRKLERTEQNLLRLADILGEVQKQLRSIKHQAGKARNYLKYTQRLKELQVNFSLVEYHKLITEDTEKKQALAEQQKKFAAVAAEIAQNDTSMSNLGNEIIDTENDINQADNRLVSIQSKIEQTFQRVEFLNAKITELQQRKEQAGHRAEKLTAQKKEFANDLRTCIEKLDDCEKTLDESTKAVEKLQKKIQQLTTESCSLQAELEDEKSGIIDIVRRTAQLHNEVQNIGDYRKNLSSQKSRLASRADTAKVEFEDLLAQKAHFKARMDDIENVLNRLQQSLEAKTKKSEEIAGQIEAENERLTHSKEARSALSSELAVLTDMEGRQEGLKAAVKKILQSKSAATGRFSYVEAILADVISADVKYAAAVEAALEGKTDMLVVNSKEKLLADIDNIKALDSKAGFICMDATDPFVDKTDLSDIEGVYGRLVEFVNYDSRYAPLAWKLLGKTVVVNSSAKAFELSERLPAGYKFVTVEGDCCDKQGIVKIGSSANTTGLISRKSRLNQLHQTITKIEDEIAQIQTRIDKNNHASEHLTKLCQELRTAFYEANTEKTQITSKLAATEESINRLAKEQPLIAKEIDLLETRIARSVEKEYNSKQKLQELEAVNNQRSARIKELEEKFTETKELLQKQNEQLTDSKVALGQAAEQSKALEQTISSLKNQEQANKTAIESAQREIQSCAEQLSQTQTDILDCEAAVSDLYIEKEKSQEISTQLHEKIDHLLERQKQTEQLVRQKRDQQAEIDQIINQLKIDLSQLEVREQNLIERVRADLGLDLAGSYENYENSDIDWDEVKEEIGQLREKIERLGNVNLDAIDQQEELEKRNEFLSSQVEDLNKSKGQLQQLINRLNKKSREKFAETFEEIRIHFQQLFRKLFGGGRADILLEDTEDILEAGIEIIARPPGKETRTISLLSGGEKAMLAIALLFAVFKTKPSPFCLLDEVDAALDEANNERFNMLLDEFKKDSQFIVITHSKRTMSIAEILYGVTMQTLGVSKKISVRFGNTEENEEVAAVA